MKHAVTATEVVHETVVISNLKDSDKVKCNAKAAQFMAGANENEPGMQVNLNGTINKDMPQQTYLKLDQVHVECDGDTKVLSTKLITQFGWEWVRNGKNLLYTTQKSQR